jgi:F-type H+-transporting ATPase subunit b
MIQINITALFQLASFLFLMFVLKRILFRPLLNVLDERKGTLETQAEKMLEFRRETRDKLQEYRGEIAAARRKALQIQEQTDKEALELRAKTLSEKRAEAETELAYVREQLNREIKEESAALRGQVESLRDFAVQRVIGRQS